MSAADGIGLPAALVAGLHAQDRRRAALVQQVLDTLDGYQRQLLTDAAVMGYVRGVLAARCGEYDIPPVSAIVAEVVDACLHLPDLYPAVHAATRPASDGP